MASNTKDIPEVRLSRLKFSNWKTTDEGNNDGSKSGPPPANTTNSVPNSQALYDLRRPEAYERMDADKPGEELAHDATIWKLYLEEAEDYDQELVKSRHASLDMLLLFAALFSAILTAFLIESKDLLQQDPADTSATLLLVIAQSQLRIERGLPAPATNDSVNLPPFSPPSSARWINGIWFSSLGLSLSAALIAMLGKEWLTAYLSSRPRSAHAHAMLRQSRIEGLERWWALHIIALLPSLLHLSLLLFSIGLVIYLRTLDVVVAAVIAGVIGMTSLFYAVTAVLGAIYEFCPYVTQISGYIKAVRETYRGSHEADQNSSSAYTSSKDLKALMWLANNARDPAVVDCSYQALAGLRLPTRNTHSSMTSSSENPSSNPHSGGLEDMLLQSDKDTSLGSLFAIVCERFIRMARNHEELSISGWANAARYTKVLIGLGSHIQRQGDNALLQMGIANDGSPNGTHLPLIPLVMETLTVSDNLWTENAPPLHAEVYTSFVTNELFLLSLALANEPQAPLCDRVTIDIGSDRAVPNQRLSLPVSSLRSQYSRSLARATTLIWVYGHSQATIGPIPLIKLLNALQVASNCDSLNPTSGYITHHSQSSSGDLKLLVPYNKGIDKFVAQETSTGILGSIIFLMRNTEKEPDDLGLSIRIAAVQTLASLAPVILQQVYGFYREDLRRDLDYTTWLEGTPLDMNKIRYITARQALAILRILGTKLDHHLLLCRDLLALIEDIFLENNNHTEATGLAMAHCGADIVPLLECVAVSDSAFSLLNKADSFNILNMVQYHFRPRDDRKWSICSAFLPPNCLPPSIRMLRISGMDKPGTKRLLDSIVERMRDRIDGSSVDIPGIRSDIACIEYLHRFTHVADGYSSLGQAALAEKHVEVIVDAIVQITHLAANREPRLTVDPVELHADAVPSFLDVTILVVNYCIETPGNHATLLEFSADVLDLLDVALNDEKSRRDVKEHAVCDKLSISLSAIKDKDTTRELLKRVDRIKKELRISPEQSEPVDTPPQAEAPSSLDDGTKQDESEASGYPGIHESNAKADPSDTRPEEDDHGSKCEPTM